MREIKFRGWNGTKLVDFYKITPLALDNTLNQDGLFIPFGEDIPLMQYTGLKDKNGTEIYEGDIWERNDFIAIVEFKCDAWKLTMAKSSSAHQYPGFYGNASLGEVIGNIHENPELLE